MKNRSSIRRKLIVIFGLLIAAASLIEGVLAVRTAREAVTEKIEAHLIDKAENVAEIIDGRLNAFFQFTEGIARMPILRSTAISPYEKAKFLTKEAAFNKEILLLAFADTTGTCYLDDGSIINLQEQEWFRQALVGKVFITEPYISKVDGSLVITVSVPIYNDVNEITGVLMCDIHGSWLSDRTKDIVVGKTGTCYVIGLTGITIADSDMEAVISQENSAEKAQQDSSYLSIATFETRAMTEVEAATGYFQWGTEIDIAAFAKIKTTGWVVIISAPAHEFMDTVNNLQTSMIISGITIFLCTLVIIYLVAHTIVKPIQTVVAALRNIAQGEGDLTVRLPIHGNDEITNMSEYFNETIKKIGTSIRQVGVNSTTMEEIGNELSSNMTETASAVHQISANINGVKQQAMTQAASVTKTAATIEEIVNTIKQLNSSIEVQAGSVAQSSASVEQMVANIASIGQTLDKTDAVIKSLTTATGDGKATLVTSNNVTQKIAEESGSLLEASSVIQHIASQTNLLAMNAAIEAAHAGEAGKGFAVVADEIRKLAEESSMQGKTITTTLKTLSGEIETLSASSKTVEEKFNAIFSLAEQVKEMSALLTEAMENQENGSKEVLSAIRNINTVTTE
ncbi:MAG: methyl-accepting chemotaxis protein, partial [Treponema sp.]